ncbi:hypothetical protein D3C81_2169530 [compost metagenome]
MEFKDDHSNIDKDILAADLERHFHAVQYIVEPLLIRAFSEEINRIVLKKHGIPKKVRGFFRIVHFQRISGLPMFLAKSSIYLNFFRELV